MMTKLKVSFLESLGLCSLCQWFKFAKFIGLKCFPFVSDYNIEYETREHYVQLTIV